MTGNWVRVDENEHPRLSGGNDDVACLRFVEYVQLWNQGKEFVNRCGFGRYERAECGFIEVKLEQSLNLDEERQ